MSAIDMHCTRCGGNFVAGMVLSTPWPAHVCPDGTRNALAAFGWVKPAAKPLPKDAPDSGSGAGRGVNQ